MEILKKEKVEPWHETLAKIVVGELKSIDLEHTDGVRTAISSDLKTMYPERIYFTKIIKVNGINNHLIVGRIK